MSEFIKVTKDNQIIEVHPDALEDHKRLGWKIVEEAAESVSVETPAKAKKDSPKASAKA
jgi:hypothetical protein